MIQGPIEQMTTMLSSISFLKPKEKKGLRFVSASLTLTSLVDVFSIMVIYLLVTTSSGQPLHTKQGVKLPEATALDPTAQGVLVELIDNKIFVEGDQISFQDLVGRLQLEKSNQGKEKSERILLQADKREPFEKINPIIMAAMTSGFETVTFAVIQKGESP